jgi:hypothetical protein
VLLWTISEAGARVGQYEELTRTSLASISIISIMYCLSWRVVAKEKENSY